jgi:alpha-ketoglutarate-dependent taurine dioxygenase
MPVSIRPLHPVFVGEVTGVDCRKPLHQEEVAAIEGGMNQCAVLVFREQNITDQKQIAFTRYFGELESYSTPGHIRRRKEHRLGPGMADFSNLDKNGRIMSAEDRVWFFKLGDRLWHSDSSFRPVPAKYSILSIDRARSEEICKSLYRAVAAAKSVLDVSSPVAKASAAALISDCAWARATAARAVASPVCAEVASVNVPTPCA